MFFVPSLLCSIYGRCAFVLLYGSRGHCRKYFQIVKVPLAKFLVVVVVVPNLVPLPVVMRNLAFVFPGYRKILQWKRERGGWYVQFSVNYNRRGFE